MDETLSQATATATVARKSTRRSALLAGALSVAILVATAVTTGQHAARAAVLDLGAAPVPGLDTGNTIPLDELGDFVVEDLNAYWTTSFANAGLEYIPTEIIYFEIDVFSGCGYQLAEIGPFYCGTDGLIYLPGEFFVGDIRTQDFAVAVIIAHEVGHHVQNLVGISAAKEAGTITTMQSELQADCLAGVWTADIDSRGGLEAGDYGEALTVLDSIGDDALGVPAGEGDHGNSVDRLAWFEFGYAVANGSECVTY